MIPFYILIDTTDRAGRAIMLFVNPGDSLNYEIVEPHRLIK